MSRFLPPVCLAVALLMGVAGFAVLAFDRPEDSVELHRVRAAGDEQYEEALEQELARQQRAYWLLTGSLFGGAALLVVVAFLSMQQPHRQ